MLESIEKIIQDLKSSNAEIRLTATVSLVNNINALTELLFESFEKASEPFLTTESMSLAFDLYIKKLNNYLAGSDDELSFWAASLLVHHQIYNKFAENILLNEAKTGLSEKTYIATTILCRTKNKEIISVIEQRLKLGNLDDKMTRYFSERINDA